eukprot:22338_1
MGWNATLSAYGVTVSGDSPIIPHTFPNIVGVIISVFSLCITLVILIQYIRITLMKYLNPVQYRYITQIAPLSSTLVKYINFIDSFIMKAQFYLLFGAAISLSYWGYYCDQYEWITTNGNQVIDDSSCELDLHCELHPSECNSPSWASLLATCGIFIALFAVPVLLIRCKFLCKPFLDQETIQTNYDGPIGRVLVYLTLWNAFFFLYMSAFSIVFGGPNINYVELHAILSLLVLWLCNNAIKYLYCVRRPVYVLGRHVLFLLDVRFGRNLSQIIFDYVTDLKAVNQDDEEKHTLLGIATHDSNDCGKRDDERKMMNKNQHKY